MNEYSIILFVFGGIGVAFLGIAILLVVAQKKKIKVCTSKATGTIVDHYYKSDGTPMPIVEYSVDGITYRKRRQYRGVVTTTTLSVNPNNSESYISEHDVIHIKRGKVHNSSGVIDQLFPLGKQLTVFYNPNKPKQVIFERIPTKKPIGAVVCFWGGVIFIVIGVRFYFLLSALPR